MDHSPMDLLDALGAHHLATPLAEAEAVALAEPSQVARERLMSRGFDQAPVRDRERWVGWASTAALQPDRKIKSSYRALDTSPIAGASASINDVLPHVAKAGFCFTVGRSGLEGFITPSDLDRHAARVHFYVLISAVEMVLSEIIRETMDEADIVNWMEQSPVVAAGRASSL